MTRSTRELTLVYATGALAVGVGDVGGLGLLFLLEPRILRTLAMEVLSKIPTALFEVSR